MVFCFWFHWPRKHAGYCNFYFGFIIFFCFFFSFCLYFLCVIFIYIGHQSLCVICIVFVFCFFFIRATLNSKCSPVFVLKLFLLFQVYNLFCFDFSFIFVFIFFDFRLFTCGFVLTSFCLCLPLAVYSFLLIFFILLCCLVDLLLHLKYKFCFSKYYCCCFSLGQEFEMK